MKVVLASAVGVAALAIVYWFVRARRARTRVPAPEGSKTARATVVLDVGEVPAESPRVQRIVHEAARRSFNESPELGEVEVRSRAGTLLGRLRSLGPSLPGLGYPPQLLQQRLIHRSPEPPGGLEDELHPKVFPHFEAKERPAPKRPLADLFDLPQTVRSRIDNPDNAVEIVRAILDAGACNVSVDHDVIRSGDRIVVVIGPERARTSIHDALNHAYFRFHESGASRGLVVSFGYPDPGEVRRREMLVPELTHVGSEAIQRMADAVSIGADPLAFAVAPPVISSETTHVGGRRGDAERSHRKAG